MRNLFFWEAFCFLQFFGYWVYIIIKNLPTFWWRVSPLVFFIKEFFNFDVFYFGCPCILFPALDASTLLH